MKRNKERNKERNETKRNATCNETPYSTTLVDVLRQYATFFSMFRNNNTETKQSLIINETEKRNGGVSDWDIVAILKRNEKFATLQKKAQLPEAQRQRRKLEDAGIFRFTSFDEGRKYYYFTSEFLDFVKIIATKND